MKEDLQSQSHTLSGLRKEERRHKSMLVDISDVRENYVDRILSSGVGDPFML